MNSLQNKSRFKEPNTEFHGGGVITYSVAISDSTKAHILFHCFSFICEYPLVVEPYHGVGISTPVGTLLFCAHNLPQLGEKSNTLTNI